MRHESGANGAPRRRSERALVDPNVLDRLQRREQVVIAPLGQHRPSLAHTDPDRGVGILLRVAESREEVNRLLREDALQGRRAVLCSPRASTDQDSCSPL